uniref:Nuclear receptor subfamily 3, group C, member 2 n=1 Tax=Eptatretus burgeri TaxID=7764 RepID=A0A8C4NLJ5_EPTBU
MRPMKVEDLGGVHGRKLCEHDEVTSAVGDQGSESVPEQLFRAVAESMGVYMSEDMLDLLEPLVPGDDTGNTVGMTTSETEVSPPYPELCQSISSSSPAQLTNMKEECAELGTISSCANSCQALPMPHSNRAGVTSMPAQECAKQQPECELRIHTSAAIKMERNDPGYGHHLHNSMVVSPPSASPFNHPFMPTSNVPPMATMSAPSFANGSSYPSYVTMFPYTGYTSPAQGNAPPQKACLICSDEASGCHYGVLTCGSCKVFFKRAIEGQHNYLCAGRNDCIIDKIRRKNCPACRLRKCIQAGMMLGARKMKKQARQRVHDSNSPRQDSTMAGASDALNPLCSNPHTTVTMVTTPSTAMTPARSPSIPPLISPPLVSTLQVIEPDIISAGFDNSRAITTTYLLSSLNSLCEKQLVCLVKWAKAMPGFRSLHIDDQMVLIQYSWMGIMSFAMGWRSYLNTNCELLYFAPDLIFNEQRMKQSAMYDLCLGMRHIGEEMMRMSMSPDEFRCMKAVLLLSTVPKEGLKCQASFEELRMTYIRELHHAVGQQTSSPVQCWKRFYQLTRLLDSMHNLVGGLLEFCFMTFTQSDLWSVEFPEMMSEIITAQLPHVLAGHAHALRFHKK